MGDSEQTSAGDGGSSHFVPSQTGGTMLANNAISGSEVSIHHHYYVAKSVTNVYNLAQRAEGQDTGQQREEGTDTSDASETFINLGTEEGSALPNEAPDLEIGDQMPTDDLCTIPPRHCDVGSSTFLAVIHVLLFGHLEKLVDECSTSLRRVCLVGNTMYISSSSQIDIKHKVDLSRERLHYDGSRDQLIVGGWCIHPRTMVKEWKDVSGRIKSRTDPGVRCSFSPHLRDEQRRMTSSCPPVNSDGHLEEAEETETNGAGVQCRDRGCRSAEQCRSRDNAELVLGTSPTGPPSIHNV